MTANDRLLDRQEIKVKLIERENRIVTVAANDVCCGFQVGMDIEDSPRLGHRDSLGTGQILDIRVIGGHEQLLVDFPSLNARHWLPYGQFSWYKGVRHRAATGRFDHHANRFRLRVLAHAIAQFNAKTGAFGSLDIDPLPHQIHLVHHIMSSGNLNWLIADDVGLGKTIEAGMLMWALRQRGQLNRVLLICPAGLTRQWQEEMAQKFGIDDFLIYRSDFFIEKTAHWKLYDRVIVSMDTAKGESHLDSILSAENWDLVVVDEGHRLGRRQYGMKLEASDRYRMAKALRPRTRSMMILTATPHQGMQDKFVALLELLRPELKSQLRDIESNQDLIRDMVYRNYKADVTDAAGQFIFRGKTVVSPEIVASEATRTFDSALQDYLRKAWAAREGASDGRAKSIGFVMTIYRKLAASGSAAIHQALVNRRARLDEAEQYDQAIQSESHDERFEGEFEEESAGNSQAREFFLGERELLDPLINLAEQRLNQDEKLMAFLDEVVPSLKSQNPGEKILVFTEYRSTLAQLSQALEQKYGEGSVFHIHGGMDIKERAESIHQFEKDGQFMLSTEAGGEGINLQSHCHIMVNYDIPWNPMRLVQRVGRLYRYGQQKVVLVVNLNVQGTLDEDVLRTLYNRIDSVVADMARVQGLEFREGLHEDILGEMVSMLDVKEILEETGRRSISRSKERIDEALGRARDATEKQREMFSHAAGFDRHELDGQLVMDTRHLKAFVTGMCKELGVEIVQSMFDGEVLSLRFPDELAEQMGWSVRRRADITFSREIARSRAETELVDVSSGIFKTFYKLATHPKFNGLSSTVSSFGRNFDLMSAIKIRWQNDAGELMREDLSIFDCVGQEAHEITSELGEWLLKEQSDAQRSPGAANTKRKGAIESIELALDSMMTSRPSEHLNPAGIEYVAAATSAESLDQMLKS